MTVPRAINQFLLNGQCVLKLGAISVDKISNFNCRLMSLLIAKGSPYKQPRILLMCVLGFVTWTAL